jgi:hypothetical protein
MDKNLEDLANEPSKLKKFVNWSKQHVNYKMGALAGAIGGGIVYYINSEHGFWPAAGGFGKQFLYNVFIAGFNIKTCEKLARKIQPTLASVTASTLIPTTQAFAITYGIHKFGGTPDAFDSSIWQVPINLTTFLALGAHYKRKSEKEQLPELVNRSQNL